MLPKHEELTGPVRQISQHLFDQPGVSGVQQQRFGSHRQPSAAVLFLIEHVGWRVLPLAVPPITGISNDPEEPGPAIPSRERPEVTKRPQRSLLHDVLGIVLIADQPACEPVRSIEVWHDDVVEGRADAGIQR